MGIVFRNVFRVATVLLALMACEAAAQSDEPQLSADVAAKIVFGLRWIAYWRPDYIINYKARGNDPDKTRAFAG